MATLRRGDEGPEVAELQGRLRELGFDAEGVFGAVIEPAVRRFQEAEGLLPDGTVGPLTRAALEEAKAEAEPGGTAAAPEPAGGAGPPVDRSLRLSDAQYLQEEYPKDLIVLHHTAGGSARSTFNWWQEGDPKRIATAYIVERDGTILEVFDPRFWAFHLGLPGTGGRVDRRSIGIELASEGWLEEGAGGLLAFGRPFAGEVYDHGSEWRGQRYFAAYTPDQTASVIALVDHLCELFAVPRRTPADSLAFDPALFDFRGIVGHHHVRADKTDLHPGFRWESLIEEARLEKS
jgi:peptidoglycan hydrolase-like protein with peptidoglycan-binding domain